MCCVASDAERHVRGNGARMDGAGVADLAELDVGARGRRHALRAADGRAGCVGGRPSAPGGAAGIRALGVPHAPLRTQEAPSGPGRSPAAGMGAAALPRNSI